MTRKSTPDDLHAMYVAEPNSGCWLWLHSLNDRGYPYVSYRGETWRAHRLFYTLFKGAIADGMTLDHVCRVRCCVNPDHLEVVTQTENMRRSARAKVNDDLARAIRDEFSRGSKKLVLSRKYGIPRTTILRIIGGQEWRG